MMRTKLCEPGLRTGGDLRHRRAPLTQVRLGVPAVPWYYGHEWPVPAVHHGRLLCCTVVPSPPAVTMTPLPPTTQQDGRRYGRLRTQRELVFAITASSLRNSRSTNTNNNNSISSSMTLRTLHAQKLAPLILGIWGLAATPTVAGAQELGRCPASAEHVTTFSDDYARVGTVFLVGASPGPPDSDGYAHDFAPARIGAVTITTATLQSPLSLGAWPDNIDPPETKAMVPARTTPGLQTISYDWDQDVATSMACHGVDRKVIPVVSRSARVGDPSAPRVAGRFRVRYSDLGAGGMGTSVWTAKPKCVIFGCSFAVKSSGKLNGSFRLRSDGSYGSVMHPNTRSGECVRKNRLTGRVIKRWAPAYRTSEVRTSVRVTESKDGVAELLSGKRTEVYRPLSGVPCSSAVAEFKISARRVG